MAFSFRSAPWSFRGLRLIDSAFLDILEDPSNVHAHRGKITVLPAARPSFFCAYLVEVVGSAFDVVDQGGDLFERR